jgi:tetratricopeptide (TPR) repeat protein
MSATNIEQNLPQAFRDEINRLVTPEEMPQRIKLCEQALERVSRESNPKLWGSLHNDLGTSLSRNPDGSRAKNIEEAIQHFLQALEVKTCQDDPQVWASIHHNLGNLYRDRSSIERTKDLELSIYHYRQALVVYERDANPRFWASLQDNLGVAYLYRIRGDRSENIEQAIDYFEQALTVRTPRDFPDDWAQTENNLGNAYLMRIRDERARNINLAMQHFYLSLQVRTQRASPKAWASTQNSLGNAYIAHARTRQAESPEYRADIKQAVFSYKQALRVRSRKALPEDWAETMNNLAGAELMDPNKFIDQSIIHIQQTLNVYTESGHPQYWARANNNLGKAYTEGRKRERRKNIDKGIFHYHQALKVYLPQTFPDRCMKTARALANLAFETKQWSLAAEYYALAFDALDVLLYASFSSTNEKFELAEVMNLPPRAAYAHVKAGDLRQAVEVLEKGRAQMLRGSFELQQQNLERLQDLGFKGLYDAYMAARVEYRNLQTGSGFTNTALQTWDGALKNLQEAAAAIREVAGQTHPEYRNFMKTLSFEEIQEQAKECPLVYLIATHAGGLALIVSRRDVEVIELPDLEQEALQKQIWRPSNPETERIAAHVNQGMISLQDIEAVKGGYFSTYALWSRRYLLTNTPPELLEHVSNTWKGTLDETTGWLWNVMHWDELLPRLKKHGFSAFLIPAGQLALLPLHAAWTKDPSKRTKRQYVIDELNISYAPSAHALAQAKLAACKRSAESLLIIDNPDVDNPAFSLAFSDDEVRAVLTHFDTSRSTHLRGNDATIIAVKGAMQNAQVLHFSTHGKAGWQRPEDASLRLAKGRELSLLEIFQLDLHRTRLAVLSACETGIPGLELIDEMIGLPAGMMQAGVPGVVGSLWPVKDGSTAILMTRFYKFWRLEGLAPAEALRQAQIWLRDFLFESPYYWAAFAFTGI